MKNYILLGIGIGLIISGSLFTYLDNKEYEDLRKVVREELEAELAKEKTFEAIESEFESLIKEEIKEIEKEKIIEEKVESIKKEDEKKEETIAEEKVALAKFSPLKNKENIYNIQFRSSKDKDDIINVQNQIGHVIDTKIEFVQGFYRLFAKDLYSEEYAQIIAHEIKREYGLNPVVRSPKQYDYMALGPKKYNEKYGIEENKVEENKVEVIEEVKKIEEVEKKDDTNLEEKIQIEQSKKEEIIESSTSKNTSEINVEKSNIEVINEEKNEDKVSLNGVTITKYESVEKEEVISTSPNSIESEVKEEITTSQGGIVVNKNTKLIFLTGGTEVEADNIKKNISELMDLDIDTNNGNYTIKSKEYFSEVVAEDLSGKLKLLFDIDVDKEKKE